MEIQIDGLATGEHTFVGYHHSISGGDGMYTVSVGDRKVAGIKPTKDVRHNDDVASSFVEFEATAGKPTVIRLAATEGERVVLSGFSLKVWGGCLPLHSSLFRDWHQSDKSRRGFGRCTAGTLMSAR